MIDRHKNTICEGDTVSVVCGSELWFGKVVDSIEETNTVVVQIDVIGITHEYDPYEVIVCK